MLGNQQHISPFPPPPTTIRTSQKSSLYSAVLISSLRFYSSTFCNLAFNSQICFDLLITKSIEPLSVAVSAALMAVYHSLLEMPVLFFPSSYKVPRPKSLYLSQAPPPRFSLLYLTVCQTSPHGWPTDTLLWPKHWSSCSQPSPKVIFLFCPLSHLVSLSVLLCWLLSTFQIWEFMLPCLFPIVSPSLYKSFLKVRALY